MTVAFFGHSDATSEILPRLTALAEDLILNHGATTLYVGNHGNFDAMTAALFRTLRERYPKIRCYVVRAYLPSEAWKRCRSALPFLIETAGWWSIRMRWFAT